MFSIHKGRPSENRSDIENKTYDLLDMLNIQYERIDHLPADTIEICHGLEQYIKAPICKNLFLTNNKKDIYCLLLLDSNKKYEAGKISKQVGSSRMSFASDDELKRYLNLTPGSVSIMGLMNDVNHAVTLAIDSDLIKNEFLCCHPCINTSTIKLRTSDIINKFVPHTEHEIKIIIV